MTTRRHAINVFTFEPGHPSGHECARRWRQGYDAGGPAALHRMLEFEKVAVVSHEMREVQHRGVALSRWTPRSTFIFVAFLAQSRPTSRRQSSRRAPRAAKQVLEFLSASFGANKFAVQLSALSARERTKDTIDHLTNPLGEYFASRRSTNWGAEPLIPALWHRTHLFFS